MRDDVAWLSMLPRCGGWLQRQEDESLSLEFEVRSGRVVQRNWFVKRNRRGGRWGDDGDIYGQLGSSEGEMSSTVILIFSSSSYTMV